MISVVVRTKNQAPALLFLLKNLKERYWEDITEVIVLDNASTDETQEICSAYGARLVNIEHFTYGGSANTAAREASQNIVVIFSAHSYPISHDFFKLIKERFEQKPSLAGLRCLHSTNDYRNYINKVTAHQDPNKSGLIFSGSAFNKAVWEKHPFREDVATFEDKEWSKRVVEEGYEIEFVPSIFHYEIKRSKKQELFRFKNDLVGNYQLWGQNVGVKQAFNGFFGSIYRAFLQFLRAIWYGTKRFLYIIKFQFNKPTKF